MLICSFPPYGINDVFPSFKSIIFLPASPLMDLFRGRLMAAPLGSLKSERELIELKDC
jgi:hypothetical protein